MQTQANRTAYFLVLTFAQCMYRFDDKLRTSHNFPQSRSAVLQVLTAAHDTFEAWVRVDKDYVNDRLQALRDMKEPWAPETRPLSSIGLDEKDGGNGATDGAGSDGSTDEKKSNSSSGASPNIPITVAMAREEASTTVPNGDIICTRSSGLLMSLIDSVTARYRLIPSNKLRLRFVHDIQFKLLRIYREDLEEEYNVYE